ncbi:MAG: glycosyltransferase family 2 protein [Pseudomonadota bacterium]
MSADRSIQYSLVVPCYNEANAIESTVAELREKLGDRDTYELIIVNDGSNDGSGEILEKLTATDPDLRVLNHSRNRGYGAALKTGITNAASEWIVITDADCTYPNERIPELVERAQNVDMVVGARTGKNVTYSKIRAIPKVFLKRFASWIAATDIPDINSGLRVFRKSVAQRYFNILPNSFSFTLTITLAMTTNFHRIVYVPIDYSERVGDSKIRPIRDTLKFFQLIFRTGTYFAPLRVFGPIILVLGIAFLISLCYDLFVLSNLTDKTVLLLLFTMNTAMFALLADMIDKRSQ